MEPNKVVDFPPRWTAAGLSTWFPGKVYAGSAQVRVISRQSSTDSVSNGVRMSDVSRDEIDAKLAAVEARLETGLVRLDGKMDNLLSEIRHVGDVAKDAKDEARQAKIVASNIKWNFAFVMLAGIGALLAVILTMWTITYQVTDTVRSINPQLSPSSSQSLQAPATGTPP